MVKKVIKQGKEYYICEICHFAYEDEEWAKKCEEYCKKYKSCNLDITKHAVQID